MMELEVIFNRKDRLYKFGEVISGKVVLKPEYDSTYSKIWITYHWRTHGKGERDRGNENKVILTEEITVLKAGDRMEYPFSFKAPNGPVTYHGHFLNVDWYLTAHAQSNPPGLFKPSKYDFLLQGGEPTGAIVYGIKEMPLRDLLDRSIEIPPLIENPQKDKAFSPESAHVKADRSVIWGLCTLLFLLFLDDIHTHFISSWGSVVLILFVVFVISVVWKNTYKHKLDLGEVRVKPASVWRGGAVQCHVDFIVKRNFHLRSITASIAAQERVTAKSGTREATFTYIVGEKIYNQIFNHDLSEGRRIRFDCALPVHPDAPATFFSTNNNLEWTVTMKANIKGWPDWEKTFPITVLPGVFGEEQCNRW